MTWTSYASYCTVALEKKNKIKKIKKMVACKFPCGLCAKPVKSNQLGVQCDDCDLWFHSGCLGLSTAEFTALEDPTVSWSCASCKFSPSTASLSTFCDSSAIPSESLSCSGLSEPSGALPFEPLGPGLSALYTNCRSLLAKMDELRVLAGRVEYDIIALTETWLDSDIRPSEVALPGYRVLRRDRSRHGGGVLLYIREILKLLSHKSSTESEFLSAVLSTGSGSLWFGVYYHPPHAKNLADVLESELSGCDLCSHDSVILVGDSNVDLLQHEDSRCQDLLELTLGFGLSQVVIGPTRCSPTSATLIDHVFVSSSAAVESLSVSTPLGSSDHNCIPH